MGYSVEKNKKSVPDPLITTSPDRLSETPVFAGARVPVQILLDYLQDSLDDFLADFPSGSREHAIAVLTDITQILILSGARRWAGRPILSAKAARLIVIVVSES